MIRIAESARVLGKLRIGTGAYIAQGTVVRSMAGNIQIGNNSMVLENSVIVGSREFPVDIGSKTVFGHKSIVLGASIGDLCEIGNKTIFMPGSKMGTMCITGEGTLIPTGMIIPQESVVVGRPAKVIRRLTKEDQAMIKKMRGDDISLSIYKENIIHEAMRGDSMGTLYHYRDKYPEIGENTYLYDSSEITGDVKVGNNTVIGAGVKIIGDGHGPVIIGNNVQILENCVLHLLPGNQLIIHDNVVIGPGSIVHGTIVGEGTVIESGSLVCDYSEIGSNCLVKAGSLVKQRSYFSDNAIIEGYPAKEIGKVEGKVRMPAWVIRTP
ncbi:MAG TPA: carbonic anhydrase/acetyltransferase [Clostridiales bacterium]|nr:carbonic anhydrase/acetyltransferase [Clostridiales bacterium]